MEPFESPGVYFNFLGDEGQERVRAAYGVNYERLAALKNRYDPTNCFALNQNITPDITEGVLQQLNQRGTLKCCKICKPREYVEP